MLELEKGLFCFQFYVHCYKKKELMEIHASENIVSFNFIHLILMIDERQRTGKKVKIEF